MTEKDRSLSDVIKFFSTATVAFFLGAIGPWLLPFFNAKLISDYFQPWVNSAASAFAALAFFVAFGFLRTRERERLQRILVVFLVILVISFGVCLWFRLALGSVWAPDMMGTILAWAVWVLAYVAFFVSLAVTLCIAAFLACGKGDDEQSERP